MKKHLSVFSIIFLFLINNLSAQTTFQKVFYYTFPGIQLEAQVSKLIIDANHDFVFSGSVKEIIQQASSSALYKTDQNGNLIWFKYYQYYPTVNGIRSIIQIPDGNYLLTGYVADSAWTMNTSFLMKVDTSGNIIWSKIFPFSSATLYLEELSISGNDIYCAGTVNNSIHGSFIDPYIVKINQQGDIAWSKYLSNSESDGLNGITATLDRGCAFVGDMLIDNFPVDRDIYYGKLDSIGNKLWTKRIVLPGYDYGLHIEQTNDGGFIICAIVRDLGFGSNDILLFKTDSLGDILWAKVFGTTKSETPLAMDKLPDGSVLISGSVLDGNIASAFNLRIDPVGNIVWAKIYGLNDGTRFYTSKVHDDYCAYVGGYNFVPPIGLWDIYFVKTDTSGVSGCYENSYSFFDSVITLTSQDVSDTVIESPIQLVDVVMNAYDGTPYIADSQFCFVNAINELKPDNLIDIFPNPNNGNFRVQIDGTVSGKFIIYNAVGKIVHDQKISSNDFEMLVSNIASGFYILKLIDNKSKTITTLKLIVQN